MAFLEIRMPTDYVYGAVGGPGWSTRAVEMDSGWQSLLSMWPEERGKWVVSFNTLNKTRWSQLITLHRLARGKLHGFRFQDWRDYTVTLDDVGSGIDFNTFTGVNGQLFKTYSVTDPTPGIFSSDTPPSPVTEYAYRVIVKPQPETVLVYYDGVLMVSQPTVDYTTGIVALSAPAAGHAYTWTGSFDVPVRFDTDAPMLSYDFYGAGGGGVSWGAIPLVELSRKDL